MQRQTHKLDAEGQAPGRIATRIATFLIGKHKPSYTPNIDAGDFVVVKNADKMVIKGKNKMKNKIYYKHTGYPGNLREKTLKEVWENNPSEVLLRAVKNMIPKNRLHAGRMKRLIIK